MQILFHTYAQHARRFVSSCWHSNSCFRFLIISVQLIFQRIHRGDDLLDKAVKWFFISGWFLGYIPPPIKLKQCLFTNSKAHINLPCVSSPFIFISPFFFSPSFSHQSLCYMAERFSISHHVWRFILLRFEQKGFVKEAKERSFSLLKQCVKKSATSPGKGAQSWKCIHTFNLFSSMNQSAKSR